MNDSCQLCAADLSAAGEVIMDFGSFALLLHPDSAVSGHAMVVAKRHVENFADLTESEAAEFVRVQRVAERALLEATGTERAILLKLGIQVPHFHVHIYPISKETDRKTVMRIIDARVREDRPAGFADDLRQRLSGLTAGSS